MGKGLPSVEGNVISRSFEVDRVEEGVGEACECVKASEEASMLCTLHSMAVDFEWGRGVGERAEDGVEGG